MSLPASTRSAVSGWSALVGAAAEENEADDLEASGAGEGSELDLSIREAGTAEEGYEADRDVLAEASLPFAG